MLREVDALVHPALMDPRQMADLDIYELIPPLERGSPSGDPKYAPGRAFDIEHTRLELRLDQDSKEVSGRATIRLRPFAGGLSELELNAAHMSFSRVSIKKGRAQKEVRAFKTYEDRIWVPLDRKYNSGHALTLTLDYKCRPRAGLYFITPDEAYPGQPEQVWSQGEDTDNHHWFPCFDHPADKMTSEVIVTVREDQIALSNGRLVSVKHNKRARTKTYHYSHDYPHPAYLVSIAIGNYEGIEDSYKGRPVRYYVYPGRAKEGKALFGGTPRMIEHFSKLFDYEYPFPKYDQVVVSDFLFGAMENTTATTVSDRALLDRAAAREVSNEDLIAHELAHQWWGDVVTCKDWSHLWLNEGFATYAETLYKEHAQGWDEARFYLIQEYITYIQEDRSRYRRPIVFNRYTYPTEMFDRHTYQKGGLVLDMLRFVLGDEPFFESIRYYLKKFEWKSAETDDLRRSIEEVTGQNLDWFFEQWLYKTGFPEFQVSQSYDSAQRLLRLAVRQVQETDSATPVFKTPVEIEVLTANSSRLFRVMIERAEHDFYFELESAPLAVNFDPGNRILKLCNFSRPAEDLVYLLKHSTDVTARVRAARELSAFSGEQVVDGLAGAIDGDKFWAVKVAAASALGEVGGERAFNILTDHYTRSRDPRVRRGCVWGLGALKNNSRAFDFLAGALDREEMVFVAATIIRALGNLRPGAVFDLIKRALERDSYEDVIRLAVFDTFVVTKDKRGIDIALEWCSYGRPKGARVGAINALGALAKEHEGERERIIKRLAELTGDKSARVRLVATRALGRTDDPAAIRPLGKVKRTEAMAQIKLAAHRGLEGIEEKLKKKVRKNKGREI